MSTSLHLVSGFLGSGKTTAIVTAAKQHVARGERVGVVTNDQGRYLVDTAFVQAQGVPTVQVAGSCFCCNLPEMIRALDQLDSEAQPEVIYAESVGSCTDLLATVVEPLRSLRLGGIPPTSLSAFADARLLLRWLSGRPLPFGDDVVYILEQQIAEANLLVSNKVDLLGDRDRADLATLLQQRYPGKRLLMQNSLTAESVAAWMQIIESGQAPPPDGVLDIDYGRYGAGERQLAWLDQSLVLETTGDGRQALQALVSALEGCIRRRDLPIGHIKLLASSGDHRVKISLTTLESPHATELPPLGGEIELLVNARVQADAQELRDLIHGAMRQVAASHSVTWRWRDEQAFHPVPPAGRPQFPTG